MKSNAFLLFPLLLLGSPLASLAAEQLIPAGSLLQCTVAEPKLSSKTADVGDPVLCQVSHVELYGRSVFPYGSYLVGRFEDYKDPGHFVGKGWMELKFERMVIPPDLVVPVAAKVVYVPKYNVDKEGRIHGKGHAARDIVEWSLPILWPIDLLTLPRRGPRPVLKAETRLTLKIMDDFGVPLPQQASAQTYTPPASNWYNFSQRAPMSYAPAPVIIPAPRPMPVLPMPVYPAPMLVPGPITLPAPIAATAPPATVIILRDGNRQAVANYQWDGGDGLRYRSVNGQAAVMPMEAIDVPRTVEINRQRGVSFVLRAAAY